MADLDAMKKQLLDFMEDLEEKGTDAGNVYELASGKAGTICDQGTPEMKALMVLIEDWIAENF